ncbi:hypothetical protein AXG93_2396s1320 [Marchantia polymorpha subsp. ruderalis]|uniref:Uncharacterized protein n=1 Tax=Marchantia polymorpha subsp. ruderalis TaxID=1480154 RepID=A0A176VEP2_MARPO|nr:hypothetical protein AXG93_2396s1320 [Marchantia polymorpha subsp. ruderalis]
MRTKYTIAVAVAVILSIATLVAATSYQSKCYNDSEHDVEVRIKLILGLDVLGLITVVKHTVVDILYTLSGLIAGLLGLTWNLSCKINNIIYSCDVYVPVGGTVRNEHLSIAEIDLLDAFRCHFAMEIVSDALRFRTNAMASAYAKPSG